MGYYSEVILVIKNEHVENIPNFVPEGYSKGLLDRAEKTVGKQCTLYHWPYIKWYEDVACHPQVAAVMAFLKSIAPKDYEIQILGEEFGDHTTKGTLASFDCEFQVYTTQALMYRQEI